MSLTFSALTASGWWICKPGETVKCPSTETVLRHDRRGGPLTHHQILRKGAPAPRPEERGDRRTIAVVPPPDSERRKLRWPAEWHKNGPRHCGEALTTIITGYTFVRPVPVDRTGTMPRFTPLEVPRSVVHHQMLCRECGILDELVSLPEESMRARVVEVRSFTIQQEAFA